MTLPYERIAIALDVGEDWADPWDARRPERGTRAAVVVSALRNYVSRKSLLSPRTRWALVALDDGAEPLLSPGSGGGAGLIVAALESLAAAPPRRGGSPQAPFPLAALAETLAGDAVFGSRPPGAVDRCVLVFSRSRAAPEPPAVRALFDDPGFFLDALYVHAKASEANKVQEVYDALTALAPRSRPLAFFFFETTSSAPRLHQHLAVLLAHPQLRDDQEAVAAKLSRPLCDDGDDRSEVVMSAAC